MLSRTYLWPECMHDALIVYGGIFLFSLHHSSTLVQMVHTWPSLNEIPTPFVLHGVLELHGGVLVPTLRRRNAVLDAQPSNVLAGSKIF